MLDVFQFKNITGKIYLIYADSNMLSKNFPSTFKLKTTPFRPKRYERND